MIEPQKEMVTEPTSFSERKAASCTPKWRGVSGPSGSKNVACTQGFPRNLGGLVLSIRRIAVEGTAE